MGVGLPQGDDDILLRARVKCRAIDVDGNPIGVIQNVSMSSLYAHHNTITNR